MRRQIKKWRKIILKRLIIIKIKLFLKSNLIIIYLFVTEKILVVRSYDKVGDCIGTHTARA